MTAPLKQNLEIGSLQMGRNASSSPRHDNKRTVRCNHTVILQLRPRSEDNSTVWRQSTGFKKLVRTDWQRWHRPNWCHVFKITGWCRSTLLKHREIERERESVCLAVKFGLQKFEYYLLGCHSIIESDHSPLEQFFRKNIAKTPSRLQRMILWCLGFDIAVVYKPGTKIRNIQSLSIRMCQRIIATMWSKLRHRNWKSNWCTSHKGRDPSWQHTEHAKGHNLQRLAESTEAVSTGTLGLLELQMWFSHWRRSCTKGRQNSYSTVPEERSPRSHPNRSPRRNQMSSPSTRIRHRHNEWCTGYGAKVWSMFKTSTSTFQVTDHAAWYANRTMWEDLNRHIWVRQRETPDDCRLLLQIFRCEETARNESTDSL